MEPRECFDFLTDEVHTVVIASVNDLGRPVTRAIDLMACEDGGLYFTTAVGKAWRTWRGTLRNP